MFYGHISSFFFVYQALQNERRQKEVEEAAAHRWDNQRKV